MTARHALRLAALLLCVAGCGSESTGPRPGELELSIATPFEDDRAIAVAISGTVSAVQARDGFSVYVYAKEDRTGLIVTPAGGAPFPTGQIAVATLPVADVNSADDYSAAIIQAASAGLELRALGGYTARLEVRR